MTDDLRTRIACVLAGITPNNTPKPEYFEMADAVIAELRQEWCVKYTYAPRFTNRILDSCDECGEPCIHDQESAAALMDKLNKRDRRFKPELVTRYVTEWTTDV